MKYEVEQKFYVDDFAAVEQAVQELGGEFGRPITQSDRYLSHPARSFAETDEAFRLRSHGEANFVTYKGPRVDSLTKTRHELELALPNDREFMTRFMELLLVLGFEVAVDVRKRRRSATITWQGVTVEVALDDVEQLGKFVELETVAEESGLDVSRQRIASLAEQLELRRSERRSYCEMLLEL